MSDSINPFYAAAAAEHDSLKDKHTKLLAQVHQADRIVVSMIRLAELNETTHPAKKAITSLLATERAAALHEALEVLRGKVPESAAEAESKLQRTIADLDIEAKNLANRLVIVTNDRDKLQDRVDDLVESNEWLKARIATLRSMIGSLRHEIEARPPLAF